MNKLPAAAPSRALQPDGRSPRLTNRQMAIVRDLAQGMNIAQIAEHRNRSLSSVYEIASRICDRIGVDEWTQIGPYALEHQLVEPLGLDSSTHD